MIDPKLIVERHYDPEYSRIQIMVDAVIDHLNRVDMLLSELQKRTACAITTISMNGKTKLVFSSRVDAGRYEVGRSDFY